MDSKATTEIYEAITDAEAADLAGGHEARNGLTHIVALLQSKLADGLLDPKLVLSWLLNSLGAPAYLVSALVPIREAGALLPQVVIAPFVSKMAQRKWVWVAGSLGQGLSAAGIALAAVTLEGAAAGLVIAGLLALLAISRAACSVSYKPILGKTVGQHRRGAVTGLAGSIASAGVFLFALLLLLGVMQNQSALIAAIGLAALLWLGAGFTLSTLKEEDSTEGGPEGAAGYVHILRDDANLRRFILTRGLLTVTALAPPYFVLLAGQEDGNALNRLGALVMASAAASFVSSCIWGRLADRSGRLVLALSGVAAALAMAAAIGAEVMGWATVHGVIPAVLFALMIAYHGVRQSRSTYLVDISPEGKRAAYAAVSNTVIGLALLATGALGGALSAIGPVGALTGFALLSVLGALSALSLKEA